MRLTRWFHRVKIYGSASPARLWEDGSIVPAYASNLAHLVLELTSSLHHGWPDRAHSELLDTP